MTLFSKIFKKKKDENPFYTKLKKSLLKANFPAEIQKAYFLFGLPNTIENAQALKRAVFNNSDLKSLKETAQYNVGVDNLELFLIEDVKNQYYFIILLDPYELYETEQVLEIIFVNDHKLSFDPELIFSS